MIRYALRFILLFIVIAVLVLNVFYFFPRLRQHLPYYATLRTYAILLFRNPFCSFSHALKGLSVRDCQREQEKLISQSCRILKKDEKGFELWETSKGPLWAPPGSELEFFEMYMIPKLLAEQECNEYGTEKQGVRPGDIVLDCGAHIGLYARKALADGAKMVVAIEPSPENIECLRRNLSKDINAGRVIVYPKGVWNREEEVSFKKETASGANHIMQESEGGDQIIHIPVTTIDKIVSELKLEKVDFIKMDIEGAEQNALTGAQQTIVKYHPRMAIATEHTLDPLKNAQRVSAIILGISDYCVECGHINITPGGRVFPEVVFFN
jgi:FkbM family methyltransferase